MSNDLKACFYRAIIPDRIEMHCRLGFTKWKKVEFDKFIESSPIEYWIYGHSHRNIDKVIGKTKCVSKQLGYVFHNEHHTFNPEKVIEI